MKQMQKIMVNLSLVIFMVLSLTACTKSLEEQIAEQLELGQKYLTELNYEEAIVAFTKAIELDEKNVDVYIGRGQVYEAMARAAGEESADGMAYYEQAAADYEQVLALSVVDSVICDRLITIYQITGNLEGIKKLTEIDLNGVIDEVVFTELKQIRTALEAIQKIADACEAGEIDWVFEFMNSEEFAVLQQFAEELGRPAFQVESGKGLGIYPVKTDSFGDCMIYYGDYQDDQRHGHGLWIGYKDGNNYCADGMWSSDMPNGSQEVREWKNSLNEAVSTRVITGSVENGLWHGDVMWIFERNDGTVRKYPVSFNHGKWVVLEVEELENGEIKYNVSLSGISSDSDNSRTMSTDTPDELEGIEGFLTS